MHDNGYRYEPRTPLPDIKWSDRLGEPTGNITRKEFHTAMVELLNGLIVEHEEMTGVASDEKMSFEEWCEEVINAYRNN